MFAFWDSYLPERPRLLSGVDYEAVVGSSRTVGVFWFSFSEVFLGLSWRQQETLPRLVLGDLHSSLIAQREDRTRLSEVMPARPRTQAAPPSLPPHRPFVRPRSVRQKYHSPRPSYPQAADPATQKRWEKNSASGWGDCGVPIRRSRWNCGLRTRAAWGSSRSPGGCGHCGVSVHARVTEPVTSGCISTGSSQDRALIRCAVAACEGPAHVRSTGRILAGHADPEGKKVLVVLMDNADWHRAKAPVVPSNVVLHFLPPCTPALQPRLNRCGPWSARPWRTGRSDASTG